MKKRHLFLVPTLFAASMFIYLSCTKSEKPPDSTKQKLRLQTQSATQWPYPVPAGADTITEANVTAVYNSILNANGLANFTSTYNSILPRFEQSKFVRKEENETARYIPLAYDVTTGKYLELVVIKGWNYCRPIIVEYHPTAAFRTLNLGYNDITGTIKYYDYTGAMIVGANMVFGNPMSIIPGNGGGMPPSYSWPAPPSMNKLTDDCLFGVQNPELDDDVDGVINCHDECPGTPANVWVDGKGCPATFSLTTVQVVVVVGSSTGEGVIFFPTLNEILRPDPHVPPPQEIGFQDPGGSSYDPPEYQPRPGFGTVCGTINMKQVGNSYTGNVTNYAVSFGNTAMGKSWNVSVSPLCIEVANTVSSNAASNIILDAMNHATAAGIRATVASNGTMMNSQLQIYLKGQILWYLQQKYPGSTVSSGACLGTGVPTTSVKYYNPNTGNCETPGP